MIMDGTIKVNDNVVIRSKSGKKYYAVITMIDEYAQRVHFDYYGNEGYISSTSLKLNNIDYIKPGRYTSFAVGQMVRIVAMEESSFEACSIKKMTYWGEIREINPATITVECTYAGKTLVKAIRRDLIVSIDHVTHSWMDRFIVKIDHPVIERATDNENRDTFDFIRIFVSVNDLGEDMCGKSLKEAVKDNMGCIINRALDKISGSKSYQKFDVPVNFLKISRATLTKDSRLELLFELKEAH